ncbi:LysR family transcriptional regulator [Glutamicibacter creatinolyticus]|uniref:LysR family transcriptional regulator n=1 Tax=Glutamicibacter creatinolyticus TaxID=162496 RepID=UPI003B97F348
MQLSQIQYFLAVAEQLSFTRGAQELNVVQSAVSAGIKQLERELGAQLFVRQGRSVRLAPAGEALLPRARAILAEVDGARDAVDAGGGMVRGTVSLGTLSYLGALDMGKVLLEIHRRYPEVVVKLRLTVEGTRTSLAAVQEGTLNLALLSVSNPQVAGIALHEIHAEPMVLVIPAGHRLAGRQQVDLSEIAGEQYVDFPEGWGNRTTIDSAFSAQGLHRSVRTEVVSLDFALELVRQELGVAFLPQSTVERSGTQGIWAVPVPRKWRIQLARATNRQPTAAEDVVMRAILAKARNAI